MKITLKKKIPTSASAWDSTNPKHKPKYETVEEVIEIPNTLLGKTIAVIDELLDRTWDDLENKSWTKTGFPLVPFPFLEKYREPENVGVDDYWISFWLNTTLEDIIRERVRIINTLFKLGGVEDIEHDPIINIETGAFNRDSDGFILTIQREELRRWRKELLPYFKGEKRDPISFDVKAQSYEQALFYLKTFYTKIIAILDVVFGGYLGIRNETVNYYYTILAHFVEQLLQRKDLLELSKGAPQLVDSTIGGIEDMDVGWEFLQRDMYYFLGQIEKARILSGNSAFAIPKEITEMFQDIDKALSGHKEYHDKAWGETLKNVKKQMSEVGWNQDQNPNPQTKDIPATKIEITKMPVLKLEDLRKTTQKVKEQAKENALFLNKAGDLYREPKETHCYPMSESEGRHRIIRYFVENKIYNYYPTSELARALEKDETTLMKEIGKINAIIQSKLKVKENILDGKRGSGYRINTNYKIALKDDKL